MSHPPSSTPVKVPGSAATYTPATLDPELRSQINSALLRDGHIAKYVHVIASLYSIHYSTPLYTLLQPAATNFIRPLPPPHQTRLQDQLLHSLDANSSNWPSAVQKHAVSLLRNGEVSTFPALIRRVLEDVRHDTAASAAAAAVASSSSSSSNNASNPPNSTVAATDSTNGAVADKNGTAAAAAATAETNGVNGNKKTGAVNGVNPSADATNLAIPPAVLETVLKLARESLESVCSIEDGGGPATNGN